MSCTSGVESIKCNVFFENTCKSAEDCNGSCDFCKNECCKPVLWQVALLFLGFIIIVIIIVVVFYKFYQKKEGEEYERKQAEMRAQREEENQIEEERKIQNYVTPNETTDGIAVAMNEEGEEEVAEGRPLRKRVPSMRKAPQPRVRSNVEDEHSIIQQSIASKNAADRRAAGISDSAFDEKEAAAMHPNALPHRMSSNARMGAGSDDDVDETGEAKSGALERDYSQHKNYHLKQLQKQKADRAAEKRRVFGVGGGS